MDGNSSPPRQRRVLGWFIGGALLILAAAAAFWFVYGNAPDEVNIDAATEQLSGESEDGDAADSGATTDDEDASDPVAADGIGGTWNVDTSIGEFGFGDTTGSFVGFRVDEDFSDIGAITAVGRTPEVSGSLEIDGDVVTAVNIEAQVDKIITDDPGRDSSVLGALNALNFPTATFVLTEPMTLPATAEDGSVFAVDAVGELTIRGAANPATFALEAKLVDDVVVVVGSTDVMFADYGITPPSVEPPQAPVAIKVEDNGIIELQLFFTRG